MDLRYPRKAILTFTLLGAVLTAVCIAFFVMWQIQTHEYKYNTNFKKVHEPRLLGLPSDQNSIRLIIDYGHKFDTIRISQSGSTAAIRGIGFYHQNFPDHFELVHDSTTSLEIGQWNELVDLINRTSVLMLPSKDERRLGLDGETWILEIKLGSTYKVIERWSPDSDSKVVELARIGNAITKIANYDFYAFSQPNHSFNSDTTSSSQSHHRNAHR